MSMGLCPTLRARGSPANIIVLIQLGLTVIKWCLVRFNDVSPGRGLLKVLLKRKFKVAFFLLKILFHSKKVTNN